MNRALLISTGIGCGVACSYCPQVKIGNAYRERSRERRLSVETFKACVDKLPKDVSLHFTGFYEPWLNDDCTAMLLYAHSRGFRLKVSGTLMGLRLNHVEAVSHIPFFKFAVHLPDGKGLTRIKVDDHYLEVLAALIDHDISNIGFHIHEGIEGPEALHPAVASVLEERGIEPENRWVLTRAGNIEIKGKAPPKRLVGELELCPRLKTNALLPNGDVVLCCMDWSLQHVIGNLLEMDYEELFESAEYKRVLSGYQDDRIEMLCRYCEIARTKKESQITRFKATVAALKESNTSVTGA